MRHYLSLLLLASLTLVITGCQRGPLPPDVPAIDPSLPAVENIKTISDMSAIGFEWTPQRDEKVQGYYLYRAKSQVDAQSMERVAVIDDRYASHFVDTELTPESRYFYRMSTYSASKQESNPSPIVEASTRPLLDSVPFIQAIVGLPNRVKLLWRPHPYERVASYIVERNELDSDEWSRVAEVQGRLNAEYIDADLKDNHVYRYRVMVRTFDGIISNPSEIVQAKTKPLPKPIENIKATRNIPKKIELTWNPSPEEDVVHYNVYRASTSVLFYTFLAKTNEPKFDDFINANGADRYYKVTAVDKDGLESLRQANPVMGTTLDVPVAPAINEARYNGDGAFLSWSQIDKRAVKYEITKKGQGDTQVIKDVEATQFLDRDVSMGATYTYEVVAIDKHGLASKPSSRAKITLPNE